jgi:hypothetical protein
VNSLRILPHLLLLQEISARRRALRVRYNRQSHISKCSNLRQLRQNWDIRRKYSTQQAVFKGRGTESGTLDHGSRFANAGAAVMRLPLSDAETADAIRRLVASGGPCIAAPQRIFPHPAQTGSDPPGSTGRHVHCRSTDGRAPFDLGLSAAHGGRKYVRRRVFHRHCKHGKCIQTSGGRPWCR